MEFKYIKILNKIFSTKIAENNFMYMPYLALVVVIIVLLELFPTLQSVIVGVEEPYHSIVIIFYFINISVMLMLGILFFRSGFKND